MDVVDTQGGTRIHVCDPKLSIGTRTVVIASRRKISVVGSLNSCRDVVDLYLLIVVSLPHGLDPILFLAALSPHSQRYCVESAPPVSTATELERTPAAKSG